MSLRHLLSSRPRRAVSWALGSVFVGTFALARTTTADERSPPANALAPAPANQLRTKDGGPMRPAGVASSLIDDLDPPTRSTGWRFYAFAGVDGRAVARDVFLDGNTAKESRSVQREPFMADVADELGLMKGRCQLTFTRVRRTQEFETPRSNASRFGSTTTRWPF